MKHIIFYEGGCPLCNRAVRFLLAHDRKKSFLFAPLGGITAKQKIPLFTSLDTLVFLENGHTILVEGKAVLRLAWHLGGFYRLLGLFSFLPSGIFDFFYRLVAQRRYHLFKNSKILDPKDFEERLLP